MSGYSFGKIQENNKASMLHLSEKYLHVDAYSYSAPEIDRPSKYVGRDAPYALDLDKLYKSYACPDYFSSDKDIRVFRRSRNLFTNFMISYRSPSYRNYGTLNKTLQTITNLESGEDKDSLYSKFNQAFASFMLWYSKYANLNAYDSYNINRLALFTEEPKYNRPDPLYLTFYPAAKTLANHIIVLPLIPFVEIGLIANSVYQANKYQNPYIVARKLLNTGSVILNNIVLLQIPNIVGFAYAFVVQSIPFTFETANDGAKVPRPNYAISNFVAAAFKPLRNAWRWLNNKKFNSLFQQSTDSKKTIVGTSEDLPTEVDMTPQHSVKSKNSFVGGLVERDNDSSRTTSRSTSFSPYTPSYQPKTPQDDDLAIKDINPSAEQQLTTVEQKIATAEAELEALQSLDPAEQAKVKTKKVKPTDFKMV